MMTHSRWDCRRCGSRFFEEPRTLSVRSGRLVETAAICPHCFAYCALGHRFGTGMRCNTCGLPRRKVALLQIGLPPDDPTIGTSATPTANGNANIIHLFPYTLADNATFTIMSVYPRVSAANTKLGIYSDSAGSPNTVLLGPVEKVGTTSGAWNDVAVTPNVYVAAQAIWLANQTNSGGGVAYSSSIGQVSRKYKSLAYGTAWPSPISGLTGDTFYPYSVYGTYSTYSTYTIDVDYVDAYEALAA